MRIKHKGTKDSKILLNGGMTSVSPLGPDRARPSTLVIFVPSCLSIDFVGRVQ